MSERSRLMLFAALLVSASVHAESGLQGLEMDVMNPGENAARATSRIALPRMSLPSPAEQDLGIDAERNARTGEVIPDEGHASMAREAAPVLVETPPTVTETPGAPR